MGSAKRLRPAKLGEKLLAIRQHYGYSLAQMANKLSNKDFKVSRTSISQYESNTREPSLLTLLKYAKFADVTIDVLADDDIKLKDYFPKT